jgi:hypothetical protein
MKLVEVKYFEPAKGNQDNAVKLDGYLAHPDRYRYSNCWVEERSGVLHCCVVGAEGWFPFPDNFCPRFLGSFPAVILSEIDRSRADEADRFTAYSD